MSERIAVIIPAYQSADTITETLTTLFAQTRLPDEVVIVDDGSTDDLQGRIQPWNDQLKYIRQENAGAPTARNRGAAETTSELLLFLDADVSLRPEALEKMLSALRDHPEASFAYSDFVFGWKAFHLFPFAKEKLQERNYIHTTSVLRRQAFPGFDQSLKKFQDWDLWLTITERGGSGYWIPETLFSVRQRAQGMSRWLPSFVYRLPFIGQGWGSKTIRLYREAERIIREKHHLPA